MRLPTFVFALALAAAPALSVQAAPAASAPAARPGTAEYTPEGAPRDDYNFVAWCEGVLEGHMALAEHVQSVLPLDEVQQKIGKAYLKGYEQALDIGKKGRSDAELDAAQAIRYAARANWNTAMGADLQLGADTYLAWQLPGRCEHAAKRVAKRDDIFKLAPSQDDVEAMGVNMSDAPTSTGLSAPAGPAPVAAASPATSVPAPAETMTPQSEMASSTDAVVAGSRVMPDEAAPVADVAQPATVAAVEPSPAEAAPAPTPSPAPTAETRTSSDGKVIHMPRKGRLLPWGKRE